MKVIDNFLNKKDFDLLQTSITGSGFPFYFNSFVTEKGVDENDLKDVNFTHALYHEDGGVLSEEYKFVYDKFIKYLDIKEGLKKNLHRSKVNCYPRTSRIITHKFHTDFPFSHKGAILSLNTCNGYTKIKGEGKIKCIENRLLLFDPSIPHASTSHGTLRAEKYTNTSTKSNLSFFVLNRMDLCVYALHDVRSSFFCFSH